MLRSLFSGVSGLQSHQIAMDVESNNIANVNTIGYKYSRANFSDLLSQTSSIATAPQGDLGGKNPTQVGLGVTVDSMTRIFSQGSVQNTDKNTDVAIQGDGFFIVTDDNGRTSQYSRSGDFKFDADGNFVDNNGYIVQGWVRDETTLKIDSTGPITPIKVEPGLTTPANATEEVVLKANLSASTSVNSYAAAYAFNSNGQAVDSDGVVIANKAPAADNMKSIFNASGEALSLVESQGVWVSFADAQTTAAAALPTNVGDVVAFDVYDSERPFAGGTSVASVSYTVQAGDTVTDVFNAINNQLSADNEWKASGMTITMDASNQLVITQNNETGVSHNLDVRNNGSTNAATVPSGALTTAYQFTYVDAGASTAAVPYSFHTTDDLRAAMQSAFQNVDTDGDGNPNFATSTVEISSYGEFLFTNTNTSSSTANDALISVTGIGTDTSTTNNILLTDNLKALSKSLPGGSNATTRSLAFNAATHSSSIDIYDSLGSKHTLTMDFRKTDLDTWDMTLTVPEPGEISAIAPKNVVTGGTISFNEEGALATYTPKTLNYTANNGSQADQQVTLNFGQANTYDGMTSFDAASATSGISQDGYTGGDLTGIRIDQSGTLIGSFSNGRSFGLAQVAMAKFANNEGLMSEGGNVYSQSANSGNPIIGTASTGGRGFIQSSALEASNVDLSRSLTQLIIIQRGFQANSKTITTSDQILNTLIGLKQ